MKTIIQPENPNIPIYYKVVSSYNRRLYSAVFFNGAGSRYDDVVRYQIGKWAFPRKNIRMLDPRLSVFGDFHEALDFLSLMNGRGAVNPRIYTCEILTDGIRTHEPCCFGTYHTVWRVGGVRLLNKVKSI